MSIKGSKTGQSGASGHIELIHQAFFEKEQGFWPEFRPSSRPT